jgi:hypothetical protein
MGKFIAVNNYGLVMESIPFIYFITQKQNVCQILHLLPLGERVGVRVKGQSEEVFPIACPQEEELFGRNCN